jgi:nitrile hydratase accessory protein
VSAAVYERRRNLVVRPDGRPVNVARPRGQLFVCASGCCCGRTEDGFAAVPAETYHREWERRRLRNVVHLTIGGCLGPCALANVALLLFDGQAQWFQSINSDALALAIYDHVERMLEAGACLPPPPTLAAHQFTASAWQPRPDGQPVDDHRPRRFGAREAHACAATPSGMTAGGLGMSVDRVVAVMAGGAALPRKNGELVFDEPWQGRVFGMAVALHEQGRYEWEEFRQALIAQVAAAEARGGPFVYYEVWLATFEALLSERGLVTPRELEETTYQFEFGERDDVF